MTSYLESMFSLRDRTAVVTGGSSGIGLGIAEALGRAGAAVVIVARDPQRLAAAVRRLSVHGVGVESLTVDLARSDSPSVVGDALAQRSTEVDILVNCAGVNLRPPMDELTRHEIEETLAVNLRAPLLLGQLWGPQMAARGWGRIINVGSQQSVRAFGNSGVYGVSKAAIAGLTRSQSEAWSASGVCSNTIVPGFVVTAMTQQVISEPGRGEALARRTHVGRNGLPTDFAGAAVFLASNAASYVTGQTVFVDGGFSVA